jgi:hypothetical protein
MAAMNPSDAMGLLPADHPHAQPLGEIANNRETAGPHEKLTGLHKKPKSTVSLKALIGDRDKKENRSTDSPDERSLEKIMKKTKSATSLSALLKRSQRGRKEELSIEVRDKENRRPADQVTTPIWAQFATQPLEDVSGSPYVPENSRTLEEEVSLYTPKHYSPSKQRNFHDYHQPTLAKRPEQKPRPKSDYISASTMKVREMLGHIQRVPSNKQRKAEKSTDSHVPSDNRSSRESSRNSSFVPTSRVMAVVSALNAKDSEGQREVDPKQIEGDFEKLLVSF